MATTQTRLLTADEFFKEYSGKEGKHELVKGEVIDMAPPNEEHGAIAVNIGAALRNFTRQVGAGRVVVESGFRLSVSPDTVRGPDVAYTGSQRLAGRPVSASFVLGAPDLAVEVVSPGDTASEIEAKIHEYLAAGALRVWVVYPAARRVAVHFPNGAARTLTEADILEDAELLPGFALPVKEIFEA